MWFTILALLPPQRTILQPCVGVGASYCTCWTDTLAWYFVLLAHGDGIEGAVLLWEYYDTEYIFLMRSL